MADAQIGVEMTLERATETWLSQYSSPNTRSAYSSDLRSFLAWLGDGGDPLVVTPRHLADYRAEREASGISPGTVNRQFAALRAFFGTAAELGVCEAAPFDTPAATPPSTPASSTDLLSPDEVSALSAASASDPRTAVLAHLLLREGVRLAEALALDHADVSGPSTSKHVRIGRHDRTTGVRIDPTGSRKIHVLQQLSPAPGPLFLGASRNQDKPKRLTRFGADHLLKRAAERAGLQRPVSANVLRRTYVSAAHDGGVPIDDIRRRMGHRDVRTTRRYLVAPNPDNTPPTERS